MSHLSKNIATELKNWKTVVRACFAFVFCMIVMFPILSPAVVSASQLETPEANQNPNVEFLLDKTITWADGSVERVQIDKDGFFWLDGEKTRLVGMVLSTHLPYGETNEFYLPENMAIWEKELTYLESIGIRLIRVELPYIRWWQSNIRDEKASWKLLMDIVYKHKMLVIPHFIAKWFTVFGEIADPSYSWSVPIGGKWVDHADSLSAWVGRFADTISEYQNVVAVGAENELDQKLTKSDFSWDPKATDQDYTAEYVTKYMTLVTGIIRSKVSVPIIHNVAPTRTEPEIKNALKEFIDIPAFDCYGKTPSEINRDLKKFLPWIGATSGWWCLELNYGGIDEYNGTSQWAVNSVKFSTEYIDTVFNQGATVAILYSSSDSLDEKMGFFNNDGEPKSQLIQVAEKVNSYQVAIAPSPVIVSRK